MVWDNRYLFVHDSTLGYLYLLSCWERERERWWSASKLMFFFLALWGCRYTCISWINGCIALWLNNKVCLYLFLFRLPYHEIPIESCCGTCKDHKVSFLLCFTLSLSFVIGQNRILCHIHQTGRAFWVILYLDRCYELNFLLVASREPKPPNLIMDYFERVQIS
jgi:hypothetical protein